MRYTGTTSRRLDGRYIPTIVDTATNGNWPATTAICHSFKEAQQIASYEAGYINFVHKNIPY